MNLKIGILLPRSDMFPTLAMDFLNGLKMVLSKELPEGVDPEYIVESVGNAVDESMLKIAEKLILQENVAVTLAFCGSNRLAEFITIFNNYKKPLVRIDLGGSVLKQDEWGPYVLHHTLNVWQSAYAAGIYAAKNLGKKGMVISSMYDGGYHMATTFNTGFVSEGGSVVQFYVAPMDYKSETYEAMIQGIAESEPEVIYAIFSYKEAQKVFDVLAKSEFNGKIPIVTIPLMTDESFLDRNHEISNVISVANWSFDDDNEIMTNFKSAYSAAHNDTPNIMALLGYEVGQSVAACVSSEGIMAAKMGESLQNKKITTPRGTLQYNDRNESLIDSFKVRNFEYNQTGYHNPVIATMEGSVAESLYEAFEELPNAGWQNPYICT
ncbi:MAG: ABC transporter substrate-binding protein [Bacteroidota bacterium]